jgi:hypothetical protein
MRDDKGKILEGAVSTHFMHTRYGGLTYFKKDAKTLRDWGANSISIYWNSGYLKNDKYLSDLTQAVEEANGLNLKVVLSLHSRGEEPIPNTTRTKESQIIKVDAQLVADWEVLLIHPTYGKRISNVAGAYGIVSEAYYDYDGNRPSDATKLIEIYNRATDTIRRIVGVDVPSMWSPPNYGRQMNFFINIPPPRNRIVIDTHVYNGGDPPLSANWQDYILKLFDTGYAVYIGEAFWGARDSIEVANRKLEFFQKNSIPFAAWGLDSSSNDPNHLINTTNGISQYGNLLQGALKTLSGN